jgi:hypothetical protein
MGGAMTRGLIGLDDAVLTDGSVQAVLLRVGYWLGGLMLTVVTLFSVLFAGGVAITIGIADSTWTPIAAALLPVVAAWVVYFVSRRRRTRPVSWVLTMMTALPLSLVPWVFAFAAMAM